MKEILVKKITITDNVSSKKFKKWVNLYLNLSMDVLCTHHSCSELIHELLKITKAPISAPTKNH